jgi:flagellar transcriptional activator FlhD
MATTTARQFKRSKEMTTQRTEQLLADIREANLTYMMLAQHLIREDREAAMFRLGVSEEVADIINTLSPAQLMKIAASNTLVARFRFDDEMVWNLLTESKRPQGPAQDSPYARLHARILVASASTDAL